MDLVARYPGNSKTGNKSPERASNCLPLDLSPREDIQMQRCGKRTTVKEINYKASKSEIESPVIFASITKHESSEIKSVWTRNGKGMNEIEYKKNEEHNKDWDQLRKKYSCSRERNVDNMDAVDWESVRKATVDELADTIKKRGMNYILAEKMKAYLDRAMRDHGSLDLEWLRDVPPKDAKDYLMCIHGIGLKSTECIRLLALEHVAFSVDVNVARVVVRLGWVPLQPLPGGLQMHLLEEYPVMDNIQKYLFPRLCTLNHKTLYELHYHLITFGKIFCTKKKPRCDGCPMSGQCKHYASLAASKRLALPAPEIKKRSNVRNKPIVEMPGSPENDIEEFEPPDIEDFHQDFNVALPDLNVPLDCHESNDDFHESGDDIPTLKLNNKEINNQIEVSINGGNKSHMVVQRGPLETPVPNYRGRLKSVHQVYELPDSHPILQQLQVKERDPEDPSLYLFAPWRLVHEQDGKPRSSFTQGCNSSEVCREIVSCSIFNNDKDNDFATTVIGTLMIPARSGNEGRFPLNGTYFQVNEVFADDETTNVPIYVPKHLLSNLRLTFLFCGANVTSAFRELPMEWISLAFRQGYFCNRGFNRETGVTTKLSKLFHFKANSQGKKTRQKKEKRTNQSGGA
ncbi:protein ROS1C-like [Apium graveolens]|uniref:protein ROS1C-like n=1 Tax=Apium graveolens TaxID=4045 RepID=UPI003D799C99